MSRNRYIVIDPETLSEFTSRPYTEHYDTLLLFEEEFDEFDGQPRISLRVWDPHYKCWNSTLANQYDILSPEEFGELYNLLRRNNH